MRSRVDAIDGNEVPRTTMMFGKVVNTFVAKLHINHCSLKQLKPQTQSLGCSKTLACMSQPGQEHGMGLLHTCMYLQKK